MELWNDYEGKTVDGRFRLERLIGPKGRSAFFATKDEAGQPAVIRLIESLNDEVEILRRWRAVQQVKQENLLGLLACDQTVLDGVHLVYAVMEHSEADLAEILNERVLTADETRQVARSVAAALEALHARGLVHEHVEPAHVVAVGEVVKLRSDLVREAPEGAEGAAMRKRDAHDLAVLILEAMTRRRESGPGMAPVPAPFDEMVRNGRSGAWGVNEMAAVLGPAPRPVAVASAAGPAANSARTGEPVAVRPSPERAGGVAVAAAATTGAAVAASGAGYGAGPAASSAAKLNGSAAQRPTTSPRVPSGRDAAAGQRSVPLAGGAPVTSDRIVVDPEDDAVPHRKGLWAIAAAGLLVAILLFWHFLHAGKTPAGAGPVEQTPAVTEPAAQPAPAQSTSAPAPARSGKPSAAMPGRVRGGAHAATQPAATTVAAAGVAGAAAAHDAHSAWRVVAFTYNREDQAQHKADAIAQQHPDLRPEVFAPKGRAPYLVTLGGWMSVDQASALRNRARSEGLPRDTYTQNYRH